VTENKPAAIDGGDLLRNVSRLLGWGKKLSETAPPPREKK